MPKEVPYEDLPSKVCSHALDDGEREGDGLSENAGVSVIERFVANIFLVASFGSILVGPTSVLNSSFGGNIFSGFVPLLKHDSGTYNR